MSRIVIRADAGAVPEIGTGHMMRSIRLAGALRGCTLFKQAEVRFATRLAAPFELGGDLVRKAGYEAIPDSGLEPNSEPELRSILKADPDIVILDRLETSAELVDGLKVAGIFIVTFDDLGPGRSHADLAINALLHNIEPAPNSVVGYDYLPSVSDEITRNETKPLASNVFVSFGGFDHRGLNAWLLRLIPDIKGPRRYEIVLSGLAENELKTLKESADTAAALAGVDVVVLLRPEDFYKRLCASDLALVSGGLTAFGCAQAGIPSIGVPQYEHQLENIHRLQALGCLKSGTRGMDLDAGLFCSLVTKLSADHNKRLAMSRAGVKAVDGKGLARTVNLIASAYARAIGVGTG
ncbi:MAG: hypothetical protein WCR74_01345 [Betaproteobacteria bacterium]